MSKTKLLTIAVIGLLLLNLGTLGFLFFHHPFPPPFSPQGPSGQGPQRIIVERLHFDGEQAKQYGKMVEQHMLAIREAESHMRDAKNELYSSLHSPYTGTPKDSLINRITGLQKQIENIHYDHFTQIKNLCRPDQLPLFNALTTDLAKFFAPHGDRLPPPPAKLQ